ncbi:MAG: DNA primase [Clostridiales bacterium]|nr:DNA primase [Clostridiales bacterium]
MSANNQSNIVDDIKSRCNIVDVIGRVVPLKKAGSNYKGVCPFHNEKTPSFVVSEAKQIYTCFGCGATGDVIGFVEHYYSLDFKGAVELLAKEYGIDLEGTFKGSKNKDQLFEINRQAARFYYRAFRERSNPGYTYMKRRGISEETLNEFGVGYADGEWTSLLDHLKGMGFSEEKIFEVGLVSRSKGKIYDKFRNRVIFPIINTSGKVIGFGGRILDEGEPKYLNSQESVVFQKKNNLYGLNLTRKSVSSQDSIVLVEGYMDVISLYQSGIRNVSASLGTALTENQAKLIKRFTKNVILSYDADSAGQNAAFRGLDVLYKEGCRAKVLKVTDGKDPDEFIKKHGKGAFKGLMDKAIPYGDFKLDMVKSKYDMSDEQQKIEFLHDAVEVLKEMKPVEADLYIKKLAGNTGISEGAIRFEYSGNNSQEQNYNSFHESNGVEGEERQKIPLLERDLLSLMFADSVYIGLPDDVKNAAFASNAGRSIYSSLCRLIAEGKKASGSVLREIIDEEYIAALGEIEENSISEDKEEKVFADCINKIRKVLLKKKEEELIAKLSMADEEENKQEIADFTQQLMEIQQKLKD